MVVPQPHKYHQGGGIAFDPAGHLWLSFGDGGGIGDRYGNGQDPTTLNGTLVRIDIDNGDPYAIPPGNPWLGSDAGADEVWAYGLRNPWRFAIDGDQIVIADVGQYEAEEVNVVTAGDGGYNFGWPVMEADACFDATECDATSMTAPVLTLPHERLCAIIGGPVYRGTDIPELHGHYLFGDHCVGWVRSAPLLDGSLGSVTDWEAELGTLGHITSIGVDHDGELLVVNLEGELLRIVPVRDGA
jgi:glucose/arabinose dehydrogenase